MQINFKFRFIFLLTAALLTGCGEPEDTRPGQPVKHRQEAFKAIIKTFEPMGVMLRTDHYDAERFLSLATDLVAKRDGPWENFGADTNYPPSKAKPAVWEQTERFKEEQGKFREATDALLFAAQTKDKAKASAAYEAVHDRCKSCHDTFKTR